jgi:hypothetical protein
MGGPRRVGWSSAVAGVVVAAASASAGWLVTDRLEQRNDFCNECHLAPGVPLHIEIRRDFDSAPATNLAAGHARAGNEARPDGAFRCIDCHGGASVLGRTRVKALAAKDGFWWLVGRFDEPDGMHWPLWDEDCTQCHGRFDETDPEPWQSPRFHQLSVHNVELGVDCVECHLSHERVPTDAEHQLAVAHVRSQCARCHSEFEEGAR